MARSNRSLSGAEGNDGNGDTMKQPMPYMYILKCVDNSYYTGSTWNLQKRLAQHQRGEGARHTAKRLPVELVYCEEYDRVEDAFLREKQIQGWSRKKKEALMAGDTNGLHLLAECRNGSHWAGGNAGFGSAQPAASAQPSGNSDCNGRSLSEAEGKRPSLGSAGFDSAQPAAEVNRSLSEVEGNGPSCGDAGFGSAQPAVFGQSAGSTQPAAEANRSLSEVEGSDDQARGNRNE